MAQWRGSLEDLGADAVTGFWAGKRVLVTGHTGFKGSWLSLWLTELGARVVGLALSPNTQPALFDQLGLKQRLDHRIGDIRDIDSVRACLQEALPDIVFHLAAQPLVLASYEDPLANWDTNVMGTAHVLEALRGLDRPCAVVAITTDKVYHNCEWVHPYREGDRLGGHDPYSASKAACELLITSYRSSFFAGSTIRIASARAGNVIGGGDWAENRLVPDVARALQVGRAVAIRNPAARRPWQHVLEPLSGYLRLAQGLYTGTPGLGTAYNFGPEIQDVLPVRDLVEAALAIWPGCWEDKSDPGVVREVGRLSLGIERARTDLGYVPRWDISAALARTIDWYREVHSGADPRALALAQIAEFGEP